MKRKLLDISEKIDPLTVAIYEVIASVMNEVNLDFIVVGATARDFVLQHGFGIESKRGTLDVDLAIQVSNWGEFEELKKRLIQTGKFEETGAAQKLKYMGRLPIDLIPFGSIEEVDGSISWPPDHEVRMNIIGFEDAYNDAMLVRLKTDPVLDVLVASPPSLTALKLISWKDRAPGNTRDAIDLIFIIRSYLDIGNNERLHEEHPELIDEDFDYIRTGARLLGRDIANVLIGEAIERFKHILEEQTAEGDKYPLVEDMTGRGSREDFDENLALLKSLKQGILDVAI